MSIVRNLFFRVPVVARHLASMPLLFVASISCAATDFRQEEIAMRMPDGVEIVGTIAIPIKKEKIPVALILAGSGPIDRDGNPVGVSGRRNDSLKLLAEGLASEGIATVRYDKRGLPSSLPRTAERDLRFSTYVTDAGEWISSLAADSRFSDVFVIGHSEGATVGLLAASYRGVSGYLSLSGPAESADRLLLRQLEGKLPGDLFDRSAEIIRTLKSGNVVSDTPATLSVLFRPSVQPYLISWFSVDPLIELRKLKVPVAIINGDMDAQVPAANAEELAKAAPPGSQVCIVSSMNHFLQDAPLNRLPKNSETKAISRKLIEYIRNFIKGPLDDVGRVNKELRVCK